MKKLNTKGIDKAVKDFIKYLGCEDITVSMDTDFAYYEFDEKITYSIVTSEKMDRLFYNFALGNGLKYDCGIFILSLLHEVGHYYTLDDIEDDVYSYCLDVKSTLTDSEEDCITYMNLEVELVATLWAIDFINNNPEVCLKYTQNIEKAIERFINKYEITVD